MLSLGHILISDLAIANLFMYSLPGYDSILLGHTFSIMIVFLHEITSTYIYISYLHMYIQYIAM